MELRLTNTLGGEKTSFEPLRDGEVRMYHCGPTVKEDINVDKFRSYLLGDILRRYFELVDFRVTQVMNITDVGHLNEFEEDAIEIAAGRSGKQPTEFVQEEEADFHRHRRELRILDADHYPRARENIPEMIALVERLLEAGIAYTAGENVYFDVRRFPGFGKLTGKSLDELTELQKGLRAKPHPEKRHPLDIDLWRTDVLHRMHWQSPWGRGYPGWHVECVVMSRKHLGETFDIHTGSAEIIYPHHECEIAEAEAIDGTPLARYWLHSAHVLVDGRPTSRANRNLLTVQGLLDSGVDGVDIRGALLSEHYRHSLELTPETLDRASERREALQNAADRLRSAIPARKAGGAEKKALERADADFVAALEDDLDVPRALDIATELAGQINREELAISTLATRTMERFDRVLGLVD